MTSDEQNLNVLGIFHYVVGGMTALFACIPLIHLAVGVAMILGKLDGDDPPPELVGWLFAIMGGIFVVMGWLLAIAMLCAGKYLRQRRRRVFCLIVAGVECMIMPYGTVLGVFTLIHLTKEPVRQLFDSAPADA